MARITGPSGDAVYNINRFLGINEAQEGDAALKLGEAAVMRNFRVTSGGALTRRPGSRNVAGLMAAYNAQVDNDSQQALVTSLGLMGEPLKMYPRIWADSVGQISVQGEAESVDTENWQEHVGEYYLHNGKPWAFRSLDTIEGLGTQRVNGGGAVFQALTAFASGQGDYFDGPPVTWGTKTIETWPEITCVDAQPQLTGESVAYDVGTPEGQGWISQDVGGYLNAGGRLYKFYGVRCTGFKKYDKWERYQCTRQEHTSLYTYYSQGPWVFVENGQATPEYGGYAGTTGYAFDASTGLYYGTGSPVTLQGGDSGVVYQTGEGTVCKRITFTATNGTLSNTVAHRSYTQGPYTGVSTYYTYTAGEELGQAFAPEGERPGLDQGMSFVTEINSQGANYTVMTDGENFYAYRLITAEGDYFSASWEWYGYPAIISPDSNRFLFSPTYAEPNGSDDAGVQGIWSGFVAGREVLCAACNGHLWELQYTPPSDLQQGEWSKISCGAIDTSREVHMFGFQENLYLLNGQDYMVWDGSTLKSVEGYRPLVATQTQPQGGGNLLERVNRLTGARRAWYSPDGQSLVFRLPETDIASVDYVRERATGEDLPAGDYTADVSAGTVTFNTAPQAGTDALEIGWTAQANDRERISAMRYAELYNGAQDSRVFLYGDGTNICVYSDLDTQGVPRADYFPDMNEAAIGDANTPITAMIRHYSSLLAFKLDSAWSIYYETVAMDDGTAAAGFFVTPVNRDVGCCAMGQAQLVENRPRTLDGRSVVEWKTTASSASATGDQRNAQRISQRVDSTIRSFDLTRARTFYDKITQEYYVISPDGTALIHNVEADAWYVYTGLCARCMINYKDQVYYGTADGYLRHLSQDYTDDNGEPFDARWESGAMDFGRAFMRKYSATVWVGVKPQTGGQLTVTAQTDSESVLAQYSFQAPEDGAVPETENIHIRARRFTYYKLILQCSGRDSRATVVSVGIRVHSRGPVK